MSFSQHTSEFDRLQTNFNNFQEDSEDDEESPPSYQQGKESWHKKELTPLESWVKLRIT